MNLLVFWLALQAASPTPLPQVEVQWTGMPDDAHVTTYPPFADLLGFSATVRLRCIAQPDGAVSECAAIVPVGDGRFGFEAVAVDIIEKGRVRVVGEAPDGPASFEIDVPFEPRNADTVVRYSGPEPDAFFLAAQNRAVHRSVSNQGDEWSFAMDDIDPTDRRIVRPYIRRAFLEHRDDWRAAYVLGVARNVVQDDANARAAAADPAAAARLEQPRDPGTFDQLNLVEIRIRDLARSRYCAENPCPPGN